MRRTAVVALAAMSAAVLASGAVASACGLDTSGSAVVDAGADRTTEAAPPPVEAGPDADGGVVDAPEEGRCSAASCNGVCVNSCQGCGAGQQLCPSTFACGSCATCPSFPVSCFTCSGGSPVVICQASATQCGTGAAACPCAGGSAAACPGSGQVCVTTDGGTPECRTCGQPATDGLSCKDGQRCDQDDSECK